MLAGRRGREIHPSTQADFMQLAYQRYWEWCWCSGRLEGRGGGVSEFGAVSAAGAAATTAAAAQILTVAISRTPQ